MSLVQGSITVRGTNRKDVLVIARPEADRPSRRFDPDATGLRRIPQTAGYRITEEANRVQAVVRQPEPIRQLRDRGAGAHEPEAVDRQRRRDPLENIDGDIDVSNTNGGITLNNVAGSVNAGTTNGSVRATLTRVTAQRGDGVHVAERHGRRDAAAVDEGQPAAAQRQRRCLLGLRHAAGAVAAPAVQDSRSSNGRYRISRNRSIVGAINGGGPEFELRTFNSNVYVRKGR